MPGLPFLPLGLHLALGLLRHREDRSKLALRVALRQLLHGIEPPLGRGDQTDTPRLGVANGFAGKVGFVRLDLGLQGLLAVPGALNLRIRQAQIGHRHTELIDGGEPAHGVVEVLPDDAHILRLHHGSPVGLIDRREGGVVVDQGDAREPGVRAALGLKAEHDVAQIPVLVAADEVDGLHGGNIVHHGRVLKVFRRITQQGVAGLGGHDVVAVDLLHKGSVHRLPVADHQHRTGLRDQILLAQKRRHPVHGDVAPVHVGAVLQPLGHFEIAVISHDPPHAAAQLVHKGEEVRSVPQRFSAVFQLHGCNGVVPDSFEHRAALGLRGVLRVQSLIGHVPTDRSGILQALLSDLVQEAPIVGILLLHAVQQPLKVSLRVHGDGFGEEAGFQLVPLGHTDVMPGVGIAAHGGSHLTAQIHGGLPGLGDQLRQRGGFVRLYALQRRQVVAEHGSQLPDDPPHTDGGRALSGLRQQAAHLVQGSLIVLPDDLQLFLGQGRIGAVLFHLVAALGIAVEHAQPHIELRKSIQLRACGQQVVDLLRIVVQMGAHFGDVKFLRHLVLLSNPAVW